MWSRKEASSNARRNRRRSRPAILEEGDEIIDEYAGSEALDAGLLAGGQAVEHHEMSRYGTLKTWAMQLGMNDASALLDQTLREEKKADALAPRLRRMPIV